MAINLKITHRFVKVLNKSLYVLRPITYSRISKETLLNRASDNSQVKKSEIHDSMDAVSREFRNFLMNGHSVEFPDLGTFRFSIQAKASETLEGINADQVYRRKIIYTPSTTLKQLLNSVNLISDEDDQTSSSTTDSSTSTSDND